MKNHPQRKYQPGADVGPLDDWPFDNPASQYITIRGAPRASGRLDAGGPGQNTRMGIWACTAGAFSCIEQGDELMTILSGTGKIIDNATGLTTLFAPGDTLFSTAGRHVTWDITQDVVKVFYGHKPGGF